MPLAISLTGNLTRDPELLFTKDGDPMVRFGVAKSIRRYNKDTDKWEDGDTEFYNCSAWGKWAENIAATLSKGMQVVLEGELKLTTYEADDGTKRHSHDLRVRSVGPSLRFATAVVTKTTAPGHDRGNEEPF